MRMSNGNDGGGNVIFKAVGNGPEQIVNQAQHVVTVIDGIDNDAHRIDIVNLIDIAALDIHFIVDAVDAFDP